MGQPRCSQMIADDPRPWCSQIIADDPRWPHLIPDDARRSQTIPDDPRWFQMIPDDPRWSQMISGASRRSQTITDYPRLSQMIPNDLKWSQTKSSQMSPGPDDSRWSQKIPDEYLKKTWHGNFPNSAQVWGFWWVWLRIRWWSPFPVAPKSGRQFVIIYVSWWHLPSETHSPTDEFLSKLHFGGDVLQVLFPRGLRSPRWVQMVPDGLRWPQLIPADPRWAQMIPSIHKNVCTELMEFLFPLDLESERFKNLIGRKHQDSTPIPN